MKKVDKIFHIADIHIRNLKRHNEYTQAFDKLYNEIKDRKTENSLIVVAGDIAHSKTEMSPELVDMVNNFFINLTNLCDTIVITGNHDCNLNNIYRLDVLSPIVKSLNINNLYYYKDSGIYTHDNIDFVVWSIYDEEEGYIRAKDIESNNVKIGLYHGPVNSARTDAGFSIYNNKVTVEMMDGYDMFLLGDIHSFQYLNDKETIAYPSSLIQQNHGENLKGHGMLVWDVESKTSEFVEIPNDYGYYTLEVIDGKFPIVDDIPPKPRLRVKVTNTDSADLKKVLTQIRKKYKVDEFTLIRTDTLSKAKTGDRDTKLHYENVHNPEHQNGLIRDYLERNFPHLSDDIVQQVQDINRELNTQIPEEEVVRNIRWTPITFEFENMFSYGEGNSIDFTDMNGVLGLFAPNTSGKSSIFDALTFCIFDKSSRAFKADHIINNRKNGFQCKFHFKIDEIDFYIHKVATRQKRGNVTVDIEFWKEENGVKTSLNGEHRRDTNSVIRQYLGSYEDFVFTCLSLQGNNSVFIDKSQSERKDLLAQLMGLDIFDKLYTYGNEEIRETNALLRKFKRDDFTEELAQLEKTEVNDKKLVSEKEKQESDIKIKLNEIDELLENEYEKLHTVDESIDIEKISSRLNKNKSEQDTWIQDRELQLYNQKKLQSSLDDITKEIENFTDIEEKYTKWKSRKNEFDQLITEIEKHKVQVSHTLKRLNTAKENLNFEVNDDCQSCLNNVEKFNQEYNDILQELQEQKKFANELVSKKSDYYDVEQNNNLEEEHTKYSKLKQQLNNLQVDISKVESNISNVNSTLSTLVSEQTELQNKVNTYHENENKIKENQHIREIISDLKQQKKNISEQYELIHKEIKQLYNNIGSVENKIKEIQDKITEAKQLEERLEAYQYYLDAVKRDGIPYELISKTIPVIQDEVNNILQQIVDFNMNIEVDGKNINAKLVYEDREWPLELGSGMERFISSVAIRVALMNISNLPRPNFIVLDEGFGALDSDNFNSLFMMFQYLKSYFDFIIVISHLDSMRDIVNDFIEIQKTNGYSKITHS